MKFTLPAASLLALALFAGPVLAQDQPLMQVAQAAVPAKVQAYLDDQTPVAELTIPQLTQRIRQGRALMQTKNLPKDAQQQIKGIMQAAAKERQTRQKANAPAAEGTAEPKVAQAEPDAPAEQTQAPAKVPPAVADYLADTRSADDMSADDLRQRVRTGQKFVQLKAVPPKTRQQIRQKMRADRVALEAKAGATQQTDNTVVQPEDITLPDTTVVNVDQGEAPGDVTAFLADNRDPASMSARDLRTRIRLGQSLVQLPGLKPGIRQQIRAKIRADRAAVQTKPPADEPVVVDGGVIEGPPGPNAGTDENPEDASRLDENKGDPEAEGRARAILADARQPNRMTAAELRKSLNEIRALLGENKLSRQTERLLRQKLAVERRILRARVTAERREEPRRRGDGRRDDQIDPQYLINIEIVLGVRRPSEDLADRELRRRIEVLLRAMEDERYEAAERARWRQLVERDRRYLRQRMVEFRSERERGLRDRPNIEIGINLDAGQSPVIDAAEADDEEIEDVLVAAPRRKLDRRYSIEEIENSAELRNALPRVEIDTIKFGFNESFVREEEVENLERVGEILERVLAAHPNEVFLIEGHTDAVGSDAYNLGLSRQRAVAVKEALSEYFVIPAENLRTAGYGERFLKIPTAEEEQENRRVSVSRATSLLGSLEQ